MPAPTSWRRRVPAWLPARAQHERIGRAVPIGLLELFLSCWMRLYGAVATEAFGHLNFALSDGDAEALFEGLLGEMADRLGLAH